MTSPNGRTSLARTEGGRGEDHGRYRCRVADVVDDHHHDDDYDDDDAAPGDDDAGDDNDDNDHIINHRHCHFGTKLLLRGSRSDEDEDEDDEDEDDVDKDEDEDEAAPCGQPL